MEILLITGSINQGGAEYQLLALADLLKSHGKNVKVLALTDYNYYLNYIHNRGINYSFIPNKGPKVFRLIKAIRRIIKYKADVIISFLRVPSIVALFTKMMSFRRIKLIISERTSLILPYYDLFFFTLANLADFIVVNSIPKLNYINKRFPFLKNKTRFIPNIIEIDKFLHIKNNYCLNEIIKFTYIGRISPEKNLINLIKAIGIIYDQGYKINLSLVGEAHNKRYLMEIKNLIEQLNLNEIVFFLGPVDNIISIYEKTDILCLVSFYEGLSNVIIEGMACGIPLVASKIPENRFLIKDYENGFLVDPYNIKDIADGLEKSLNLTFEERKKISERSRLKLKELFNQELIFYLYEEIIGK